MFKQVLPDDIIYTKVPRGLIVSVRSKYFFDGCNKELKFSAYQILDKIITILKTIPNDCVIESHIGYTDCTKDITNWELSMIRSSNIADYLFCKEIPTNRIFDIGFGKNMPFEKNVYPQNKKSDDRVDFVIINYEARR